MIYTDHLLFIVGGFMVKLVICFLICFFVLASCAVEEKNESIPPQENIATDELKTSSYITPETIITETEYYDTKRENEESSNDMIIEAPLFSIDLNYDGITEDFFISSDSPYDEFSIVMYDDTEKKHISDKTKIYRTDKIDIYKESGENNTEYYYAVFEGSAYKSFQLNCLYTGNNKSEHCFGGYSYGENLSSPIYCFVYNSTVYKKDFDELINDNKSYLYKYDNLEYVTTIDLTNYYNPKYSEEYLSEINICDGMKKILLYNLENDIFDKSIKLTNGTYSYYANKCSNIEIYRRPRRVWEYDSNGEAYISEAVDDYDYLLCLKSSDEKMLN